MSDVSNGSETDSVGRGCAAAFNSLKNCSSVISRLVSFRFVIFEGDS